MNKLTYSFQMDEDIKMKFDNLCENFGMDAATAFNIFANAVVREQRIPFEIGMHKKELTLEDGRKAFYELRRQAKENGLQSWTLDDINEEIRKTRYGEDS